MDWPRFSYSYDGSFAGFLTCVFTAYANKEEPACFLGPEEDQAALWPQRTVDTDQQKARRVYRSLDKKLGPTGRDLFVRGFLTCLKEKELWLWRFVRMGYDRGPGFVRDLTDPTVDTVRRAVQHLNSEAHQYKGFVRFSELSGILVGEIEPKNRVLPLLRPQFRGRYPGEMLVLLDRTHREALFSRAEGWAILPVEDFQAGDPDQEELAYRKLWRGFYDAIAIEGRYNPKCRMTHMPKRYWAMMTEFQKDWDTALPDISGFQEK